MTLNPKFLPVVMIVIDVLASAVYLYNRDWRHGLYWLFAAALTVCMTY